MSDASRQPGDAAPVEVRLYRGGSIAYRATCEDADEAAALVREWADQGITGVEIDDLSVHHEGGQVLEPDLQPDVAETDELYPHD